MKKIIVAFTALSLLLGINACKKYEEGPSFTLKTKKKRLVGEWELESFNDIDEVIVNEYTLTDDFGDCGVRTVHQIIHKYQNLVWDIETDNDVKVRHTYVRLQFSYGLSFNTPDCKEVYTTLDSVDQSLTKTWEFNNDKAELVLVEPSVSSDEYQIIRLADDELKLEDQAGNILVFKKRG